MSRELTSAEQLEADAVWKQVGPEPRHTCCAKCGSSDVMLVYGAGLFGFCEMACSCGWTAREDQRAYVLKLRAALKPVLLGFNPPVEPSDNSDLD